jgi:hypothetical protein
MVNKVEGAIKRTLVVEVYTGFLFAILFVHLMRIGIFLVFFRKSTREIQKNRSTLRDY